MASRSKNLWKNKNGNNLKDNQEDKHVFLTPSNPSVLLSSLEIEREEAKPTFLKRNLMKILCKEIVEP